MLRCAGVSQRETHLYEVPHLSNLLVEQPTMDSMGPVDPAGTCPGRFSADWQQASRHYVSRPVLMEDLGRGRLPRARWDSRHSGLSVGSRSFNSRLAAERGRI